MSYDFKIWCISFQGSGPILLRREKSHFYKKCSSNSESTNSTKQKVHVGCRYSKNSEYDQEIPQSQTADNPVAPRGRAAQPSRHQEDKLSKATSSLFPIKMIAILEWTQSNVQQNIEQLQTPTMGVTINKKSTTTEPPP